MAPRCALRARLCKTITLRVVTPRSDGERMGAAALRQHRRPVTNLFGPFLVHEQIGKGGMATVHRAELSGPRGLQQTVALKRMFDSLAQDPQFVSAFEHEGRLAKTLEHENIARTFDAGRVGDTLYIAMEYIPGATLQQIMTQSHAAAGAIPLQVIVAILIQLCDALDHAHRRQIIHRDVAPANVIVSSSGVVKLIDFGVAKSKSSQQSQVGMIKGKLAYVAPEYTFGILDHRVDLFSLGVIAYELITGQRLLLGDSEIDTIMNVRNKPIYPPSRYEPKLPADLDDIVLTAVQRAPAKRWQSARAMRTALANVAKTLPRCGAKELRTWIEWAFAQQPRNEKSVLRVLGELERSAVAKLPRRSEVTVLEKPSGKPAGTLAAKPPPMKAPAPRFPEPPRPATVILPPPRTKRGGSAWYLVLAALLAGSGVAATLLAG